MMSPSPQLAPRACGASHKSTTVPWSADIFFNLPLAKKPIHLPSGEKNGVSAPSVPASGAARSPMRCRYSWVTPPDRPTKTTRDPSGVISNTGELTSARVTLGGSWMDAGLPDLCAQEAERARVIKRISPENSVVCPCLQTRRPVCFGRGAGHRSGAGSPQLVRDESMYPPGSESEDYTRAGGNRNGADVLSGRRPEKAFLFI